MRRFNDPGALVNPALVHTVEVSEAGDAQQFFTLWLKGGTKGELGAAAKWAQSKGLLSNHKVEIYHAGAGNYGWLPQVWPGKESEGWSRHYHVDLAGPPVWTDFTPYVDQIPEALQDAVVGYLRGLAGPVNTGAAGLCGESPSAPDLDAPQPEPEVTVVAGDVPSGILPMTKRRVPRKRK